VIDGHYNRVLITRIAVLRLFYKRMEATAVVLRIIANKKCSLHKTMQNSLMWLQVMYIVTTVIRNCIFLLVNKSTHYAVPNMLLALHFRVILCKNNCKQKCMANNLHQGEFPNRFGTSVTSTAIILTVSWEDPQSVRCVRAVSFV
jgi:signal transduction histidine kinase